MRDHNIYKSIVENSSVGYSYNRIIYDHNGEPKDYEFIELNQAYESIVGIQAKDLIGKRMSHIYRTVKKSQTNWNNFYNNIIPNYKMRKFEYYFDSLNKHYKINIHSPKKDYIIISLRDISEEIEIPRCYISKEETEIKERILYSSMAFTRELLTNDNPYHALSNGITMLGNATQVDRVYYWENHYDEATQRWLTSQKLEWCLDDIEPQIDNLELQNVPFEKSDNLVGILAQNKSFNTHVRDMADGKNSTKQALEAQSILSILAIPIFVKDEFRGFIGFDSCRVEKEWSQVEISLLNSFVLLYEKSLEKNLLEKHVVQVKENFYNFFNMIQDLLVVVDYEGNILDINYNVLERLNYAREELIGKSFLMLHPKDDLKEIKHKFKDVVTKKKRSFNMSAITKDGQIFPIEMTNSEGLWNGQPAIFSIAKDVSELSMSEEKFSKAFNDSGVSKFITRFEDGKFLDVNDKFLSFLGYTREEVIGKNVLDFQTIKDRRRLKEEIETHNKVSDLEVEIITKNKGIRTGLVNIVPLNINNEKCLLSSIIDITNRVQHEQKLLEISNRDSLTGIYNRHCVYQRLEEIIQEYKRNDKLFSVGIIDIDNFKAVNDEYGHQVGDYVLVEFSKIISDNLRLYDIFGRYGGEEFIVIFNHSNKEKSNIVLERILHMIRNKTFVLGKIQIKLTFSAGISPCEDLNKDEISIDKLVEIADKRMYIAKKNGKNRIIYKD